MNSKFFQTTLLLSATVFMMSTAQDIIDWEALVPDFGVKPGKPYGSSGCEGAVHPDTGKITTIPCDCPPPRDVFMAALKSNVAANHVLTNPNEIIYFPTGNDKESQILRMRALWMTLLNFRGYNQGCPLTSTTWLAQVRDLEAGKLSALPPSSTSMPTMPPSLTSTPTFVPTMPLPSSRSLPSTTISFETSA